jgi:hypothetical protein
LPIQQNPNNALFYFNRALIYYHKLLPDASLKDKIVAYQQMVQDLDQAISLDPSVEKYVRKRNDFARKLEIFEKELQDKMNTTLDLHLSCSEESIPQPDSAPLGSELVPPPAQAQVNQSKRTSGPPTLFAQPADITSTTYQNSKRSKPTIDSAPSSASRIILPRVTVPDTINLVDLSAHPWQSLPPTPPDKASPSPKPG